MKFKLIDNTLKKKLYQIQQFVSLLIQLDDIEHNDQQDVLRVAVENVKYE